MTYARMTMKRFSTCTMLLLTLVLADATAQPIPFDSARWDISGQTAHPMNYMGQPALLLQGGMAVLQDASFTNGVIEFDIAFAESRTFTGVQWRRQDDANAEEFYFRPHLSGMPDANQYAPTYHGLSGWQLYHGPAYSAPVRYRFNTWMHVKLVVSGNRGEVYLDSDEPILAFDLKRDAAPGSVGIYAANLAPVFFANFSYREEARPALKGTPIPPEPAPAGTVTAWSVSSPFPEAALDGKTRLTDADKRGLTWQSLPAEPAGITNLAQITDPGNGNNTVFARLTIQAERDQVKKLRFGYSDRVKVYVNDRLVYSGTTAYATRDYRYLGTIGLFDAVYLPLKRGTNEVWMAVSEDFGGWGILAQIEDQAGITLARQ